MQEKDYFFKIKGIICNVSIETANICYILPRPAVSNGLVFVKLKQDHKYMGHAYFEPVCPHIIYQVLACLKSQNKFYEDIPIRKYLSSEENRNDK